MARKRDKEKQKKVLGSIAAIQTMLERYPTLLTADFDSINLSVSFLMALLGMLHITQRDIAAWFAKLLSGRFNDGLLNVIEESIKTILLTNIKSLYTCPVDPLIPDELLWDFTNIDGAPSEGKGFDIDLDAADMMGILSYSPLTDDGKMFYFDNDSNTADIIKSMDDLYKSRDFNAFLWYVIHRGSVSHVKGSNENTRKSSWDNRCRYFKRHEYTDVNYKAALEQSALTPYFVCEYVERQESTTEGTNRLKIYLNADRYRYKRKYLNIELNRTIFEFNFDYIYSLKLFDSKTLTAQIINAVLGLSSTVTGTVSLQRRIIEEQLHEVVKRILENDDSENDATTESYFKFSNDEYDSLLNMANQKYNGQYKTGVNDYTKVPSTEIINCINKIGNATTTEEETEYISETFYTAAESMTDNSERSATSEEWGVAFSIQTNLIERFIEEITTQLALCMLSPKVSILYAINAYVLKGNADDLKSWETFLSNFGNVVTSIVKKIKDIIVQELYSFAMDKLKPILEYYTNELLLETIRDYKDLLANLLRMRKIGIKSNRGSGSGNIIDNVDYADIIPQKNNPD